MRLAALVALSVAIAAPDFRVTRTVSGVRLRIAAITADQMQLFVVGGPGLRVFRHARLERQRDGSFVADLALPDAGLYMAFADVTAADGPPQMLQQAFAAGNVLMPRAADPADEPHESNGISASIDTSRVTAGRESALAFDIAGAAPGALAEAFVVSSDLTEGQHLLPRDASQGAHAVFAPVFPRSGRYKVWVIVQSAGSTATIPFLIDVR